ncbi:YajG family lipoprotein [Neptuniibacter sp. CAU 1671]|uniref:YajG family lipoprotein n=1 Tax=Neptuniibacter sp. CAU 1671 TaxID=3032593 RepID=UPI0023D9BE9B|nr:YajG family lipoprotein [Neptuniibacter sp. CAU 1671]MDF2182761.1 YajG family lipoprotein [Neptuniibacter sp. CAU 1671]
MRLSKLLPIISAAALLSGCASFVAQTVIPEPQANITQSLPPGITTATATADLRPSQKLGNRLNHRGDQAAINAGNLAPALNKSLQEALIAKGIKIETGRMQFTLELTQLTYKVNPEGPGQTVSVTAGMRARLDNGSEHYLGQYSTTQEQRFIATPNEGDNTHLVNRALEATLQRCLNDPKLLNFLKGYQ